MLVPTGEQQTRKTDRLRDGHNIWATVRQCNPGAVGRPWHTGMLWQTSRVPAHGLCQIVSNNRRANGRYGSSISIQIRRKNISQKDKTNLINM